MSDEWRVKILRWPYSTGKGADVDQKAAGDRETSFTVRAESIGQALQQALLYQAGVLSNPAVWQAPIVSIEKIR